MQKCVFYYFYLKVSQNNSLKFNSLLHISLQNKSTDSSVKNYMEIFVLNEVGYSKVAKIFPRAEMQDYITSINTL